MVLSTGNEFTKTYTPREKSLSYLKEYLPGSRVTGYFPHLQGFIDFSHCFGFLVSHKMTAVCDLWLWCGVFPTHPGCSGGVCELITTEIW